MHAQGGVEGEIASGGKILFWLQPKGGNWTYGLCFFNPAVWPCACCSLFPCCFPSCKMQVITLGFWVQSASPLLPSSQWRGRAQCGGFLLAGWGVGHAGKQGLLPVTNTGVCGKKKKREKKREREREKTTCLLLSSSDLIVFHQNILLSSWALSWERFPHPLSFLQGEYCLCRWWLFALRLLIYGAI